MKRNIRVVLKSGYSFAFQCEGMKTRSYNGELTGYSFDGAKPICPMFIRLDDISAVIDEGECENVFVSPYKTEQIR